jgi:hypothetical protein
MGPEPSQPHTNGVWVSGGDTIFVPEVFRSMLSVPINVDD